MKRMINWLRDSGVENPDEDSDQDDNPVPAPTRPRMGAVARQAKRLKQLHIDGIDIVCKDSKHARAGGIYQYALTKHGNNITFERRSCYVRYCGNLSGNLGKKGTIGLEIQASLAKELDHYRARVAERLAFDRESRPYRPVGRFTDQLIDYPFGISSSNYRAVDLVCGLAIKPNDVLPGVALADITIDRILLLPQQKPFAINPNDILPGVALAREIIIDGILLSPEQTPLPRFQYSYVISIACNNIQRAAVEYMAAYVLRQGITLPNLVKERIIWFLLKD